MKGLDGIFFFTSGANFGNDGEADVKIGGLGDIKLSDGPSPITDDWHFSFLFLAPVIALFL